MCGRVQIDVDSRRRGDPKLVVTQPDAAAGRVRRERRVLPPVSPQLEIEVRQAREPCRRLRYGDPAKLTSDVKRARSASVNVTGA